ncbi:MAG: beta-galactosidase [Verrucomicrobiota bacterium]
MSLAPLDLDGNDGRPDALEVKSRDYDIRFNLLQGGAVVSLLYKPLNHEFRAEKYYSQHNNLFVDFVRQAEPDPVTGVTPALEKGEMSSASQTPCEYRILKQTDDELVLEFTNRISSSPVAWMPKIVCRREVTIRDDTPALRVMIEVLNTDDQTHPVSLCVYNGLSLGRVESSLYLPAAEGKLTGPDSATEGGSQFLFGSELSGAWTGGVNEKGLGGAVSFEWPDLDAMNVNMWKTVGSSSTVFMRRRDLAAGQSFRTAYTFLPLQGFGTLDGMAGDLAGGARVGNTANHRQDIAKTELKAGAVLPVTIFLASGTNRAVRLRLTATHQEDGVVVLDETKEAQVVTGQTTNIETQLKIPSDGLYVLKAEVTDARGTRLLMEKGLEVGRTKCVFTPSLPPQPKLGQRDAGETVGPAMMDPQFKTIDRSFTTQFLPFLKNSAGGTAKVFFMTPADSTLGHVREISQRGDTDYEYFALGKASLPPDSLNLRDVGDFRKKFRGRDSEVLVSLALNWTVGLNPELIRELLERVRGGMGLVVMVRDLEKQPELKAALEQAKPLDGEPLPCVAAPVPKLLRFQLGQGRVAVIPIHYSATRDGGEAALGQWDKIALPGAMSPVSDPGWRGFEYSYAWLAQVIQWAARRDSNVTISSAVWDGKGVRITLFNSGKETSGALTATARDRRWKDTACGATEVTLPAGVSEQFLPLDQRPVGGLFALEIQLHAPDGKLLAFGSAGASAAEPVKLRIAGTPLYHRAGQPCVLAIEASGEPLTGTISVQVRDQFGRLVLNKQRAVNLAGGKAETSISLNAIRNVGTYHEVCAEFTESGAAQPLARITEPLFLLPDKPDDRGRLVLGVADGAQHSALHIQATLRTARNLGFGQMTHCYSDLQLYRNGLNKVAIASLSPMRRGRYTVGGEEQKLDGDALIMHPPLLPNEAAIQATKKKWQETARKAWETGAWHLNLDDERRMSGDFDLNPQTLAGFRLWLRKRYADIGELNRIWGTAFADFDAVVPSKKEEVIEKPNVAPWLEFRMFTGELLGKYYMKNPSEWAAEIAPGLSVGEMGMYEPSSNWPVDWSQYAKYYTNTQRYGDTQGVIEDVFRSFAPKTRHGMWTGYGMRKISDSDRLAPWRSLLNGGNTVWYWAMTDPGSLNYAVNTSDQRPTEGYATLARDEFPDLTGGLDQMILASQFTDDHIAVAYSHPSWIADSAALGAAAKRTIEELGLQFRYINVEDLPGGILENEGIRFFVLQEVSCLSQPQAEAMHKFAARGGVILSVGKTGWRDLHGAPHAGGSLLDPLLGVDTRNAQLLKRTVVANFEKQKIQLEAALTGAKVAGANVLASAEVDGATIPILTTNKIGNGKVFWLNSTLRGRAILRAGDDVEAGNEGANALMNLTDSRVVLFDRITAEANIVPRARFVVDGKPVLQNETWYYQSPSGRSQCVAHHLKLEEEKPVRVIFDRKAHVYDMRTGKYYGFTTEIEDDFPAGRMNVYALLDEAITSLTVVPEKRQYRRGELAQVDCILQAGKKPADLNALRVSVTDAGGADLPAFRSTLLACEGKLRISLPLALDEPLGKHTVRVTDAISHTEAEAEFEVIE